jgi:hypothetical protein
VPYTPGKLVKIGPRRWRVVHEPRQGQRLEKDAAPGSRRKVPKGQQDPNLRYCPCGRKLNKNNKNGSCRLCFENRRRGKAAS